MTTAIRQVAASKRTAPAKRAGKSRSPLSWDVPPSVSDERVRVGDLDLRVLRGGTGPTLVVIHDMLGNLGWLPLYEELSGSFSVVVPDLPGYGQSDRPDWARTPRDLAVLLLQLAAKLEVDSAALAGLGFGGYLAAEMATTRPHWLTSLVLVGPFGLKPEQADIADPVQTGFAQFGISGFSSPAVFAELFGTESVPPDVYTLWDHGNEMTARVSWRPWLFSRRLPHLLHEVRTPTLIVHGTADHLAPIEIAHKYAEHLPMATVEEVPGAGHFVDLEQPSELAAMIRKFAL